MRILDTARSHFDVDIKRARSLLTHAQSIENEELKGDILRSAWMIAVGASDAYFCDAYADLISRTLRAKEFEKQIELPPKFDNLLVPVAMVINENSSWRWRMAARMLIERESVLSIKQIRDLFNQFFDGSNKIINKSTIESWINHEDSKQRLWGMNKYQYRKTPQSGKGTKRAQAVKKFEERMTEIFQRRHDCIHNCDRPKVSIQGITQVQTEKSIEDIEFLVYRCHEALKSEFPNFLQRVGFSTSTWHSVK